jgi:hypothetical protein
MFLPDLDFFFHPDLTTITISKLFVYAFQTPIVVDIQGMNFFSLEILLYFLLR